MTRSAASMATLSAALAVAISLADAAAQPAAPARIALTFDDLPVHGPMPPGMSRLQVVAAIVEALKRYQVVEAYGFINGKPIESAPELMEVLRLWRAAGYPLGNHAYSHMDLHANPVEPFEQDVRANEPVLRELMGDLDWRWFRYPYLREGDTPDKYDAVRAVLQQHAYRVAQVTVSFDDWAYNDPYVRCLAQGDRQGLAWLEQSYMDRAAESLARGQESARRIFGRDINHVMLLHVGSFQTVMLPRLLELLRNQGFAVISLREAQADKAYEAVPQRPGPRSGTFLRQVDPGPPPAPVQPPDVFTQLGALCRGTSQ